jgi:hypothetical protein
VLSSYLVVRLEPLPLEKRKGVKNRVRREGLGLKGK